MIPCLLMGKTGEPNKFDSIRMDSRSGAVYVSDIGDAISRGLIPDVSAWSKIGFNAAVTTEEIISPQGGSYTFPTAEQHMHILGGSEDKVDGTGIRELTIYYLNSKYEEKSITVVPTAGVAAETTVSDIFRIQNVRAKQVGGSTGASSNISIKNHAETLTYGYIATGNTRQRQMVWTVPKGYCLSVSGFNISCDHTAANKRAIVTIKATYDDKRKAALTAGTFFMPFSETILENSAETIHFDVPLVFPQGTDIIVVGASDGTATVSCAMRGWLCSHT